jgi:uncharacterized Zn finger protein
MPVPNEPAHTGKNYCRHCGRETESATELVEVGGIRYEVSYCANCGIASGAFRLTTDGKSREDVPENILLRKMHRTEKN